MKRILLLTLFLLPLLVGAQSLNDFRSIADCSWSTVASWETYDGSIWVSASYYPGNGATGIVTVSHNLTLDVSVIIPDLVIDVTGTLNGSGNFTLTTTGNITCNGTMSWTNNAGGAISVGGNLNISGTFSIFNRNLTVTGTTILSGNGAFTDGSDTGNNNFSGVVTLSDNSTFTTNAVTTTGQLAFGSNFLTNSAGAITIGTATINGNLEVNSGTFTKASGGTLSVTGTTTLNNNATLSITSNSQSDFTGKVTVNNTAVWNSTGVITSGRLTLANGIEQNSTGTIQFGVCTFQSNPQQIAVADNTGSISFAGTTNVNADLTVINSGSGTGTGDVTFNGNVTILDGVTLANNRTIVIYGLLDGIGAAATYTNNSILEYRGTGSPMATGVFNVANVGTTVNYSRDGNQTIRVATYNDLIISREGANTTNRTKTLDTGSPLVVNGNLTINEYNLLYYNSTINNQIIQINGDLTLTANSGFYTPNADVIQSLIVAGTIDNSGTIYFQRSTTKVYRYRAHWFRRGN
jgi:hypothetical protein